VGEIQINEKFALKNKFLSHVCRRTGFSMPRAFVVEARWRLTPQQPSWSVTPGVIVKRQNAQDIGIQAVEIVVSRHYHSSKVFVSLSQHKKIINNQFNQSKMID
jgi:hypothetical protein